MLHVTRRSLLALTGIAAAVQPVPAEGEGISLELRTLIAAHEAAYVALHAVFHRAGSSRDDRKEADRAEQQALLAICSWPAINREDRRAKVEYLLAVEARGELDQEEHMRAILCSIYRTGKASMYRR